MAFYIELPRDDNGNRLYPSYVVEGEMRGAYLYFTGPPAIADRWEKSSRFGWIECDGPARRISDYERSQIVNG